MAIIEVMADNATTISVSKEFHYWLKGKGKKGESYEDLIKRMLKPESLQELGVYQGPSSILKKGYLKPKVMRKAIKDPPKSYVVLPESRIKHIQKAIKPQKSSLPKIIKNKQKPKVSESDKGDFEQWGNEKRLELQHLKTEFELAKLSNDTTKIGELVASLARLKEELRRKE